MQTRCSIPRYLLRRCEDKFKHPDHLLYSSRPFQNQLWHDFDIHDSLCNNHLRTQPLQRRASGKDQRIQALVSGLIWSRSNSHSSTLKSIKLCSDRKCVCTFPNSETIGKLIRPYRLCASRSEDQTDAQSLCWRRNAFMTESPDPTRGGIDDGIIIIVASLRWRRCSHPLSRLVRDSS
jgi:hypothetical protein